MDTAKRHIRDYTRKRKNMLGRRMYEQPLLKKAKRTRKEVYPDSKGSGEPVVWLTRAPLETEPELKLGGDDPF